MSDNRDSGLLGGLILGAGFAALAYYLVAAPIYVARRWGIPGIAWLAAALTALCAFLIPAEDAWLTSSVNALGGAFRGVAAVIHAVAHWPWAWIAGGLSAFATLLTFFPQVHPPGSRTAGPAQTDCGTPSPQDGA